MNDINKQIEDLEFLGNQLVKAIDWWNSLSGENKLIRLVAYEKGFGKKIDSPDDSELLLLYYLEFRNK